MPRNKEGPRPFRNTIVRWFDSEGKRVKANTPGATRLKTKSETWYVMLQINGKRKKISLETREEEEAWNNLRRIQKQEAERRAGIRNRYTEQAEIPLKTHISEWVASVLAQGSSEEHCRNLSNHATRIAELAGWQNLDDISLSGALTALGHLQMNEGKSSQTRNHYTAHIKQFSRWLVADRRLRENPLIQLKKISVETDRRHDRRAPTDEEIERLMEELHREGCPVLRKMTGPQRAMLYKVSMATGFRAKECRTLQWDSFDLEKGTVLCLAAYSKRKRKDRQPLPDWLVQELKEWKESGGKLFQTLPVKFPGEMLKSDLKRAGVPRSVVIEGNKLFFDFHSLRHWYCTQVANQPGISVKTLVTLTRHSTTDLALKVYAKVNDDEIRKAAEGVSFPRKEDKESS